MSATTPLDHDESWFADIDCPRYFDFSAALQAPCSADLLQNPPLHDFVYESDDDSRRFFTDAPESVASPRPKRPQKHMLDPKYFGEPVHRHRPVTSFEQFLREYHTLNNSALHNTIGIATPNRRRARSALHSHESTFRDHVDSPSLRSRAVLREPIQRVASAGSDDEDEDVTLDLKTPTLDAIVTPITMRRARRQFTPSRVLKPTNLTRSLFQPSPSSASPIRNGYPQARRALRAVNDSAAFLRSSTIESGTIDLDSKHGHFGIREQRTTPARSSRLPKRTTPPITSASSNSGGLPRSGQAAARSRPYIDRPVNPSPSLGIGPPQRATRPSPSSVSPDSEQPTLNRVTAAQRQRSPKLDAQVSRQSGIEDSTQGAHQSHVPSQRYRRQKPTSQRDLPVVRAVESEETTCSVADGPGKRYLNAPMRKTGRHVDTGPGLGVRDTGHGKPCGARSHGPAPGRQRPRPPAQTIPTTIPTTSASQSSSRDENCSSQSLTDLLQSENDKVMQKRKDRLPERSVASQRNREAALRRIEQEKGGPRGKGKRTSVKVEFTASKAVNRTKSQPSGTTKETATAQPNSNFYGQRGMPAFRTRVKSTGPVMTKNIQQTHQRNAICPEMRQSRPRSANVTMTDQVKAAARQQREEREAENHLQSILSQHNSRVKSNRRAQT